MDISAKSWELEKNYQKHDIVKVDNLSVPNDIEKYLIASPSEDRLISDKDFDCFSDNAKISDEEGNLISIDPNRGMIFKKTIISGSIEVPFGFIFSIDTSIPYTFKTYVRKNTALSDTIDPYLTHIEMLNGVINKSDSVGVGIGVKFFDIQEKIIEVENYRPLVRPMASSELSESEYYNVQLDVHPKHIPVNAVKAQAYIFVYGHQEGGFEFRNIRSSSVNKFFYCVNNHTSNTSNYPSASNNWTQNFVWRPSYGSSGSYRANNESMKLGEGYDYVNNLAINSLPLELNVRFNNRTDKEAKAIIHFLQEKHFPYESIYALDYKGERLLSTDVQAFNFIYSFPYRTDLKFTCVEFSHSIDYRNNNNITSKFICNTESTLRSVESHAGYNVKTDAVLPIRVNEDIELKKGETIKLDSFSMDEDQKETLSSLIEIYVYQTDENNKPTSGVLFFRDPQELAVDDCIYIDVEEPEDSIFSIGFAKVFKVINNKTFIFGNGEGFVVEYFEQSILTDLSINVQLDSCETLITEEIPKLVLKSKLLDSGDTSDVGNYLGLTTNPEEILEDEEDNAFVVLDKTKDAPASVSKLKFCPQDCLAANALFPEGCDVITKDFTDKVTGEKRKRIIHLSNYVQLELESDIGKDSYSFEVTPLSNFTLKSEENYNVIVPAICGRSSIYIEDPERIAKFPYYKVRNFEHRPTLSFNLSQKPTHTQSKFLEYYNKRYKKSINQNMSTFNVVFDMRDDDEAVEILQFLESHLGYKKFRFAMPRPYGADASSLTTPGRPNNSVFYCPDWQHDIVYKNNHLISATFIESTTNIQEDISNIEEPCFGVTLFDNINRHSLCTFSSVAVAGHQSGLEFKNNTFIAKPKNKQMDLIFVIDGSAAVSQQLLNIDGVGEFSKYQIIIDSLIKSVTGYDRNKFPYSENYGDKYDTSGEPPWYNQSYTEIYEETNSIIFENDLKSLGYDIENFKRFNVRIEQNRVNIGICIVGHSAMGNFPLDENRILDLPNYPKSFDKKFIQERLRNTVHNNDRGKEYLKNICDALSQLYNSNRASIISERYIFLISDFNFKTVESEEIDKIRLALRDGNELSKRRPLDSVLGDFGEGSPRVMLNEFSYAASEQQFPGGDGKFYSYLYNPDFSPDGDFGNLETYEDYDSSLANPDWYGDNLKTTVLPVSLGVYNQINSRFYEYAEDYNPSINLKDIQMCYEISNGGSGSEEASRAVNFFEVIESLTYDTGAQNLFSINIKNCGPNPIKIKNTIINFFSDGGLTEWTTEIIRPGITKNNDLENFEMTSTLSSHENNILGYGGQYFGDPINEKLLASKKSNILWKNFNTKHEVWRNGKPEIFDKGWDPLKENFQIQTEAGETIVLDSGEKLLTDLIRVEEIRTEGVNNTGVAFKNFPVRVFTSDKGIDIIDYNIGNVDEANSYHGDYNHIPILQDGESIDLFFGIRFNSQSTETEKIELIFNAEDLKDEKMDCYARFPISMSSEIS
jgi:phage-related protein